MNEIDNRHYITNITYHEEKQTFCEPHGTYIRYHVLVADMQRPGSVHHQIKFTLSDEEYESVRKNGWYIPANVLQNRAGKN